MDQDNFLNKMCVLFWTFNIITKVQPNYLHHPYEFQIHLSATQPRNHQVHGIVAQMTG
jgi:hypothetical protein